MKKMTNQDQNNFKSISPKEWKLKVQAELAGLDYNEVLVWDTLEGIQIKPVYTEEDKNSDFSQNIKTQKDWKLIGELIDAENQDYSYLYGFKVKENQFQSITKLPEYLDFFYSIENPYSFLENDFSKIKNLQYLGLDVIGNFASTGNWYKSQDEDFELMKNAIQNKAFEKSIEINASLYQNAGANHVQQIAYAIAHGIEYLEKFGAETAEKIYFKVAIGGNYFFEIAKLRALRKLWNFIVEESYGIQQETFIYAENSLRNKSILDIHNNIIRSGLEASSAIQGKADAVNLLSFNSITNSTDFSEELASKQQLLLQKEAYFDKFSDPISGAYYIENLSELIIKNALDIFQRIEADGGFIKSLFDGSIQRSISKSEKKEQDLFDKGELVLIGVNKFRNPEDKIQPIEKKSRNERTLIQPILAKRLSEKIENQQNDS